MAILSNQVECDKCGDKPFSMHRYHYNPCKCGAVAVDGGMDYTRRVGDFRNCTELTITCEDGMQDFVDSEIVKAVTEAMESGRNPIGVALAALRGLRDSHYNLEYHREGMGFDLLVRDDVGYNHFEQQSTD